MSTPILITDFVWPSAGPERDVLMEGLGDGVDLFFEVASDEEVR